MPMATHLPTSLSAEPLRAEFQLSAKLQTTSSTSIASAMATTSNLLWECYLNYEYEMGDVKRTRTWISPMWSWQSTTSFSNENSLTQRESTSMAIWTKTEPSTSPMSLPSSTKCSRNSEEFFSEELVVRSEGVIPSD